MEYRREEKQVDDLRQHLRRRLEAIYGDRLQEVQLFGSYARDEAGPESDLDILVVLSGPLDRYQEYRRLGDLTVECLERFGIYVAPVVISEARYATQHAPLLLNIAGEGVAL